MGSMVPSKKWLLSGIIWIIAMVSSIILLTIFYGRDSIFLHNNILGIIPTTFQFLLCVSFIMYFLERKHEKTIQVHAKSDA
jgi:uncharacterized membrane protein